MSRRSRRSTCPATAAARHASWTFLLIVIACFHPSYNHPACGRNGECPSGMTCNSRRLCEMAGYGETGVWSFASAADFGAPGQRVQNMTVEARGSLTPNAYTYGGLIAHGLQGQKLWQHGSTSWANLNGATPSGAGLWRGERIADTDVIAYLGITDKTVMTVWFEGEVWLDAGSQELFALDADDVAFIEIARPGMSTYTKMMENGAPVPIETPDTGWYPIRIGFANGATSSNFNFTHSDSGSTLVSWTRDRLRARTSELSGALRTVFGRQIFGGGLGSALPVAHFDENDLLTATTFTPPPQGAGSDDWSARYAGQVYLEQPGAYTLSIRCDDGSRSRLGTAYAETHWKRDDGTPVVTYSVPAMLSAGWNDLIVDYNQMRSARVLGVQLSGPDFAALTEVPRDRLRPVESADDRLVLGGDDTQHTVPDNGGAGRPGTASMTIAGYPGETVTSLDVTYEITTPHWDQLKVDLETPGTPSRRVMIQDSGGSDDDGIAQLTIPAGAAAPLGTLLGGPANGTWKLHVYDVVSSGGSSTLENAKLTLHTSGGPEQIARTASWTSQVLDAQTSVFAIDNVTWDERLQAGATLEVRVGTCQRADCSDATWSAPVAQQASLAVSPGRYLQLRVDMTSNGVWAPELRALSVTYRRDPEE